MLVWRSISTMLAVLACACAVAPAQAATSEGTSSGHGSGEPEVRGPEPESRGRGPEGRDIEKHGREGDEPKGGVSGRPLDLRTHQDATAANVLASLPSRWCGLPRATDYTRGEHANGVWRFHAVYALASDGADGFAAVSSMLQTDAFQASALLEKTYGRAVRFDMGTDCGPQFLDITVLRLPESTATLEALAQQPAGTLDAVARALDANGMVTAKTTDTLEARRRYTRNYLVWLDAPGPPDACGQATMQSDAVRNPDTNRSNFGGNVAVVYRNGTTFCNSTAARHEIAHTLGALEAPAPNMVDGAHCSDAYEDTMCVESAPVVGPPLSEGFFDFGNDDYWSPPGGSPLAWWTVDQSRFLCPNVDCNVPRRADARLRLRTIVTRGAGRWTARLRVTGAGRALVTVSCRPRPGAAVRAVHRRRVTAPASLRARVRCSSRPTAAVQPG